MRRFEGYQKGVNLGGWLSQADEKTKEHYDTFIVREDIERIAGFGCDHVRVPVDYIVIEGEDGSMLEDGYKYIDNVISWCREFHLNVLIDMHNTFGYTFDPLEVNGDKEIFFRDEKLQERFYIMWDRISKRYADQEDVAFELLNEVISPDVKDSWNAIADKAVDVIRKNAPKAYIVIGGVCYNNVRSVPLLNPPKDDHIVYNFHCYEPMIFTHQRAYWMEEMPKDITVTYPATTLEYSEQSKGFDPNWAGAILNMKAKETNADYFAELFEPAVEAATKNNAPLYCGEYGVIDQAPAESTIKWIKDIHDAFERYGIGRSLWNYKEKDFGLIGAHYDSVRDEMVKSL
ncbi:glycoside hydrolase family 5 protein [Butyrivibrio sp. FCS014]|uniref:glycoside hydrolase family 5 protein n=1 Tax=Butyrivibrio sp. FCS014 TaxID=1408304 RepID=UPI0004662D8C|nr:cellulase family glycosylhydrolase [Butyrivibrio sp. FCS014]